MRIPSPAAPRLFAAAALCLAVAGQCRFSFEPKSLVAGAWLWLGAAVLTTLATGARSFSTTLDLRPTPAPRTRSVTRASLVVLGLALGVGVVALVDRSDGRHWPSFALWCVALFTYLVAFLPIRAERAVARPAFPSLTIVAIVAAAFVIRTWDLPGIPWSLGGDEASQGIEARKFLAGSRSDVFGVGWYSMPNLSFVWPAIWLGAVSDDTLGLRLSWAVIGTLTLPGFYWLAQRLFDRETALVSTVLLAGYHYHVHYSRLGSSQIGDGFFATWTLYLTVTAIERSSRVRWAAAGIVAGLGFHSYAGSRQAALLLLGAILAFAIADRERLRGQFAHWLAAIGGFAIAAGPIVWLAVRSPQHFERRVSEVGIFQSGWLVNEAATTGRSVASLLAQQFERAFLSYNFHPDRVAWYGIPTPLMDFSWSVLLGIGLFLCVARLVDWRAAIPLGWFLSVLALGGALTENPPSSQRLVGSALPAVMLVAVALRFLASELTSWLPRGVALRRALTGVASAVLVAGSLHFYFVTYQRSRTYGWNNTEFATRLGTDLRDLGPGWTEYFHGAPRMFASFPTTAFLAPETRLVDVSEPTSGLPRGFDGSRDNVFVFLPERARELAAIRRALPSGELDVVGRVGTIGGEPFFLAYRVPRGAASAEP